MIHSQARIRIVVLLSAVALLAPALAPVVAAATPTDLFISEYLEGSASNKAVEIYNGTGGAIDLAVGQYALLQYTNGSLTPTTINLIGTVANGDVFVVASPLASAEVLAQADQQSSSLTFNGNDALELRHGATTLDIFGTIGLDPGLGGWGGLTQDHTLVRKPTVTSGRTANDPFDPTIEWDAFAIDTFIGLGAHQIDTGGGGGGGSDTGTVDAQVSVPSSAACLQISTSAVDFGTLPLGSADQPGSPDITVTNCSGLSGDVFARGTDASAGGAAWSLVDSTATCADTLGLDSYRLGLERLGTETGLGTTNKSIATLASGASDTRTGRIFTACPGSTGSGTTMTFQIIFLATTTGV